MDEQNTKKLIGYARVSTNGQELKLQFDALEKAGCLKNNIFFDKVSGAKSERPGLQKCLQHLKPGDCLIVWRLDRLGRSMRHLIDLVEELKKRGVGFKSLCDGHIDTTSASGELIFHIFTALAQFERSLIKERTKAGLFAARARGHLGGRRPINADNVKVNSAKQLYTNKEMSIADICTTLSISRATLYRYLGIKK
jgi:DNA invertase Pin-like site-specific DNA recombinase